MDFQLCWKSGRLEINFFAERTRIGFHEVFHPRERDKIAITASRLAEWEVHINADGVRHALILSRKGVDLFAGIIRSPGDIDDHES